jgi:zinc/manganese transport system permease protein
MAPQLSWNPVTDVQLLLQYPFMQNAFLAGAMVAVVAGAVGYYMVLRAQTFAGHALAHIGFAGAAGALLFGVSVVLGLLVVCVGAAVGMGLLGDRSGTGQVEDGVAIAGVYTFALGVGLLFLQLYPGQAENAYSFLFGSVLGISISDVETTAATAGVTLVGLVLIGRPLLFSSLDPEVALARGVPVRALSIGFLVLLAFAVAQAVQVVGILLIFALLVTPAATAQRLTLRPVVAIVLSIVLALLFTWLGLAAAYFAPAYLPSAYSVVGFYVTSIAFVTYAVVRLITADWVQRLRQTRVPHIRLAA